jgi:hypothetical protein
VGCSFTCFLARAAWGDILVDGAIIADNRGFPDYYSHAVVNEYTNISSGVNLDAREDADKMSEKAGKKGRSIFCPGHRYFCTQAEGIRLEMLSDLSGNFLFFEDRLKKLWPYKA